MHDLILALPGDQFFTATGLGQAIASLMKAAALLIILVAAVKAVKDVLAGKVGKAAQLIIGAAVVVAFLWNPSLITDLVELTSRLVGDGVKDVNNVAR